MKLAERIMAADCEILGPLDEEQVETAREVAARRKRALGKLAE